VYKPAEVPEEARKMARKFFEHAETAADTRNYDYAVELYIQGLSKDPEAVQQGHQALREVALKRVAAGGKKPGLLETFKRSTTHKDPLTALLNAEYLLAKDPFNLTYIEAMAKNADRAELPQTLQWILPLYFEATRQDKKISVARLINVRQLYEKLADYFDAQDQPDLAVDCLQRAVTALETALGQAQRNMDLTNDHRDLASKLTIMKGKYEKAGDFRDSIQDAEAQKALQDTERVFKSEDTMTRLIEQARAAVEAEPTVPGKVNHLADLLLQRGKAEDEQQAIAVLTRAYEQTGQYSFKMRADDVELRQLQRKLRQAKADFEKDPDNDQVKARAIDLQKQLIRFETDLYKERVAQYPTDMKLKYEYGVRLFKAKQYDEAIPLFQQASSDPRYAVRAKYNIGSCFFSKGWYEQAAEMLTEAIDAHLAKGDTLHKEMLYVLGRTYEQAGKIHDALQAYNQVIKLDYNYRDARQRIEKLKAAQQ